MVVKKEILSRQIEEVNNSHSEKHQALVEQSDGMLLEMNVTCYNSTIRSLLYENKSTNRCNSFYRFD